MNNILAQIMIRNGLINMVISKKKGQCRQVHVGKVLPQEEVGCNTKKPHKETSLAYQHSFS